LELEKRKQPVDGAFHQDCFFRPEERLRIAMARQ
jgi:hypothetical protein